MLAPTGRCPQQEEEQCKGPGVGTQQEMQEAVNKGPESELRVVAETGREEREEGGEPKREMMGLGPRSWAQGEAVQWQYLQLYIPTRNHCLLGGGLQGLGCGRSTGRGDGPVQDT